jgi:two-component system phosphate regulon sensor histidine kinase PhoR
MELLLVLLSAGLAATLWWALRLRARLAEPAELLPEPAARADQPLEPLFDAAATALDAGLLLLDGDHHVRYLNPQAHELLGLPQTPVIGEGLIALLRDYQVDALADSVLRDGQAREHVMIPTAQGRTLRVRMTRFALGEAAGVIMVIRDITHISQLERARRDMVANVSHELRTPLASVKLLVETLQTDPPPQIATRMLAQMAQEVDAVTQLVDELHELSQIESGRVILQMTAAPLAPVAARAIERLGGQAERQSVQLICDLPESLPNAIIDSGRIGQVLLNLLHNAIKFTPPGGVVTLSAQQITVDEQRPAVGYVERRLNPDTQQGAPERRPQLALPSGHSAGEWLVVSVADTGVGIPNADLPRIFERFYKVDRARTRDAGGSGLGLAIAKHLVEGHGGRIWATSSEGQGSTFFFMLLVG